MSSPRTEVILTVFAATTGALALFGYIVFAIYCCKHGNCPLKKFGKRPTDEVDVTSDESPPRNSSSESSSSEDESSSDNDGGLMSGAHSVFDDAWSYAITEDESVFMAKERKSSSPDLTLQDALQKPSSSDSRLVEV